MKNGIFTFDWASVLDAILVAIATAVIAGLVSLVAGGNFDVFSADWVMIGKNMVNLAFTAGVITLGKDFLSTNTGSFLAIGPEQKSS